MSKFFDLKGSNPQEIYKLMTGLVGPRPIGWISTISKQEVPNLAPYSFFNLFSNNPPVLGFSAAVNRAGRRKDSLLNAEATGCFVHNIVTREIAEKMNQTSEEFPHGVNEFEKVGLTAIASQFVAAPRVKEAAASVECRLRQIISFGDLPGNGQLVLGEVVAIHIHDEQILDERNIVVSKRLPLIGRLGRTDYAEISNIFSLDRP